jgi:GTPase
MPYVLVHGEFIRSSKGGRKGLGPGGTAGESPIRHIDGHTLGIKPSQLKTLERTFRRRVPPREVVTTELAGHLAAVSRDLDRQVGVLLTRDGQVRNVVVGDARSLEIPEIGRLRGTAGRLRGLRLVHTHLKGEPLTDDDLNDLALLRLDLVAMIEVTGQGGAGRVELAHIIPLNEVDGGDGEPFRRITAPDLGRLDFDFASTVRALEAEFSSMVGRGRRTIRERALVIGISPDDDHFRETLELARSADVDVAGTVRQKRPKPHPKTVVGGGKIREIVLESMRRQADVAIFDVDVKPAQSRAFEDETGMKLIDRTQLVLDIFAQRARSRDGRLQVELARLKYSLPRLSEKEGRLSRISGGIGGRGPGETVLEVGRRRINERIRRLEKEVERLARERHLRRSRRHRVGLPEISIVGYTNAGKTTLLNALTESSVEAADQLFVTLDPTTRRLRFPREGEVVLSDTVGFLRDLPEELVKAFRATLEELETADLLIHVIDATDPALESKIKAVDRILADMGLQDIPCLRVLNKSDALDPGVADGLARLWRAIPISAAARTGLEALLDSTEKMLAESQERHGSGISASPRGTLGQTG